MTPDEIADRIVAEWYSSPRPAPYKNPLVDLLALVFAENPVTLIGTKPPV